MEPIQWLPEGKEPLSLFRLWYDKNKQALNAQRRHKYHSDPEYREKILASQQKRNRVKRVERRYRETIFGQVVRAYPLSEVSLFIGKRMTTIRHWENTGLIPTCIFLSSHRYFTTHQINLLGELSVLMIQRKLKIISSETAREVLAAQRKKIFEQWAEQNSQEQVKQELQLTKEYALNCKVLANQAF